MSKEIENEVLKELQIWKDGFNSQKPEQCASVYSEDATMKVKGIGVFEGREQIKAFWDNLINEKGARDVQYKNPQLRVFSNDLVVITSEWEMNIFGGVITCEKWVRKDDKFQLEIDHFEVTYTK